MNDVYTLDDLISREVLDNGTEKPARLAVIGQPIAHSMSPQMHQAALDGLGLNARYIRIEVMPGQVHEALRRMRNLDFIGCNVTVPHKFEVMDVCSRIDPAARALGAVNTVRFVTDGVHGFNTDAPGFQRAVEEVLGHSLHDTSVCIVGAGGGAGQAIAVSCAMAGVKRLVLVNRTVEKLHALEKRIRADSTGKLEMRVFSIDDSTLPAMARACEVIVQTTSVGLKTDDPSVLPADCMTAGQLVYDTIYKPPVTPLLALAQALGCRTANGESMLLHQGALAFQIWFPATKPLEWMRQGLALSSH